MIRIGRRHRVALCEIFIALRRHSGWSSLVTC
jgi:hypothetical protein